MGLPDVGKANDVYVDMVSAAMRGASDTDKLQEYARQLAPMGQAGMKLFQTFMENAAAAQGRASPAPDRSGKDTNESD